MPLINIEEKEIKFYLSEDLKEKESDNFLKLETKINIINLSDFELVIRVR